MVAQTSGFRDWIVQRVTAVLIGLYALFVVSYLLYYQPLYYAQWHALFSQVWMKLATFVVMLSILWHAWVGLWTVLTDYVKPVAVRLWLNILVILFLIVCIGWGFEIMWAVKVGPTIG